jgi:hypothetical protein
MRPKFAFFGLPEKLPLLGPSRTIQCAYHPVLDHEPCPGYALNIVCQALNGTQSLLAVAFANDEPVIDARSHELNEIDIGSSEAALIHALKSMLRQVRSGHPRSPHE